jgi:hypothetical protein
MIGKTYVCDLVDPYAVELSSDVCRVLLQARPNCIIHERPLGQDFIHVLRTDDGKNVVQTMRKSYKQKIGTRPSVTVSIKSQVFVIQLRENETVNFGNGIL